MRAARLPPRIAMSTCSPAPQPSRRPIYPLLVRRGRQRYLPDRVSLAGVAAQRQRIRCLDHRGSGLVAVAALDSDRRHGGGLSWGLRMTFLVLAIPMIAIGLVSLRLSSLRELDESPGPGPGPT